MNLNRREFVGLAGAAALAGGLPTISEPLAAAPVPDLFPGTVTLIIPPASSYLHIEHFPTTANRPDWQQTADLGSHAVFLRDEWRPKIDFSTPLPSGEYAYLWSIQKEGDRAVKTIQGVDPWLINDISGSPGNNRLLFQYMFRVGFGTPGLPLSPASLVGFGTPGLPLSPASLAGVLYWRPVGLGWWFSENDQPTVEYRRLGCCCSYVEEGTYRRYLINATFAPRQV